MVLDSQLQKNRIKSVSLTLYKKSIQRASVLSLMPETLALLEENRECLSRLVHGISFPRRTSVAPKAALAISRCNCMKLKGF